MDKNCKCIAAFDYKLVNEVTMRPLSIVSQDEFGLLDKTITSPPIEVTQQWWDAHHRDWHTIAVAHKRIEKA
jgi:hypothetical protein